MAGHQQSVVGNHHVGRGRAGQSPGGKAGRPVGPRRTGGGRRRSCSLPGHPEVFCIGDMANHSHQTGQPLPGVSPVAMQQARYVARLVETAPQGEVRPPFEYVDKGSMATIGRSAAVVEMGKLRLTGLTAWVAWLAVHIWYLIGFKNRMVVMLTWAWSYLTYKRGARLITGGLRKSRPWPCSARTARRPRQRTPPLPHRDERPSRALTILPGFHGRTRCADATGSAAMLTRPSAARRAATSGVSNASSSAA